MTKTDIWQHVKTGGLYRVSGECVIEATMQQAVIYVSLETQHTWVRPAHEFYDGRFTNVSVEDLRRAASNPKRSPDDWLKDHRLYGVTILDPDGWDRKNYAESWAEEITFSEMQSRVARSTVQILSTSPMNPQNLIKEQL